MTENQSEAAGDVMLDDDTLARVRSMSPEEKLELIKKALYSEEHMLKTLVKILFIVDPDAADDIADWMTARIKAA